MFQVVSVLKMAYGRLPFMPGGGSFLSMPFLAGTLMGSRNISQLPSKIDEDSLRKYWSKDKLNIMLIMLRLSFKNRDVVSSL